MKPAKIEMEVNSAPQVLLVWMEALHSYTK